MNSVLQIFLNINLFKEKFIYEDNDKKKKFLSFLLNSQDKYINKIVAKKGYLVLEFIKLLKEKWSNEQRNLNPKSFKEVCGEYNSIFKSSEQQDAHDFYTFLVDKLHEETNIKSNKDIEEQEISENPNIPDLDLSNESWANTIRKNASYFYALFMGQMKSTLVCTHCKTKKIKFEPFSSLEIPIPESETMIIEIILFRLPFTLKNFSDSNNDIDIFSRKNTNKNGNNKTIGKKEAVNLKESVNSIINKNELLNNLLNLNIPLKLRMKIKRKDKCSSIIEQLKKIPDLNLESGLSKYTELIIISKGKYISENLIINETIDDLNYIFIYEVLNYKGIINIFNYKELNELKILQIKQQNVTYYSNIEKNYNISNQLKINKQLNIPYFYFSVDAKNNTKYDIYEIIVPIIHRTKIESKYIYFYKFQDFLILSGTNGIKSYHLYDILWKKYMYFLNSPVNYEDIIWWKKNQNNQSYIPFFISLIQKDTLACSLCPWFRICSGCCINPSEQKNLNFNNDIVIVVEWDSNIYTNEIEKKNLSLILNHSSVDDIQFHISKDKLEKMSIYDCLKDFTKNEEINDIQCEKCKAKRVFKKKLNISKIPKYLVIVLKRFKCILTHTIKIKNLVNFPLEDLNLQEYVTQKDIDYQYDLFGVINHIGSLEVGHYYSIFNINGKFIEFNDTNVNETNSEIENNKVYILIYESKNKEPKDKSINFLGLMDTAYRIYISKLKFGYIFNYLVDNDNYIQKEYLDNCQFYYGEPLIINKNKGYLLSIKKCSKNNDSDEDMYEIRMKIKNGYYVEKINISKITKETYKKKDNFDVDKFIDSKDIKSRKINIKDKKEEVMCGSQVCTIY